MPAKQLIAVNASTGAFVNVPASIFSTYVEIQEDGSITTAQGLQVKFPSDGFTQQYDYPPGSEPIKLGASLVGGKPGNAPLVGCPAQTAPIATGGSTYKSNTNPATVYCQVRSMTTTATAVRVDERP